MQTVHNVLIWEKEEGEVSEKDWHDPHCQKGREKQRPLLQVVHYSTAKTAKAIGVQTHLIC